MAAWFRPGRPNRPIVVALALAILPLAGWTATHHMSRGEREAALAEAVPQAQRAGYATSDRCEACHPAQYHSWHRGYHRTMTQYATPQTVRGDFAAVTLTEGDNAIHLSRRGDDFFAEMVDPLWQYQIDIGLRAPPAPGEPKPRVERRISMVTGSHHMQAYWVSANEGNIQLSLPFTYLFDDRRWVPRSQVFLHPPDQDHYDEQMWNVSCIRCHTTGGQPLALGGSWNIRTRLGENGIACEACHGPADAHVAANQNPLRRYWLHIRGQGDPTIVNPARLPAARAGEVCGQCHSLTDVSQEIELGQGKSFVPGDELEKSQPLLRPLHPSPALDRYVAEDPSYLRNYAWADGTLRVSSRDFSGMIESRCMQSGKLWCGTCHSLHDSDPVNLLARGKDTDAACASCHPAIGAAPEAHTHHAKASEGSRCYNCHMPYTVYGLLKGIRNHRIDSPRVTPQALAFGGNERPNACNLCHLDRSLGWTSQQLARWWPARAAAATPGGATAAAAAIPGSATAPTPGSAAPAATAAAPAPATTATSAADDGPAAITWLISGDAVLRALAAWHFGWQAAQQPAMVSVAVPYLAQELDDPYAAVRYVAGHALQKIVPGVAYDYQAPSEARRKSAAEFLQRWLAKHPLNESDAQAIDARIHALLGRRDETPVRAME